MNFQVYKMAKWGEGDPRWIGMIFFIIFLLFKFKLYFYLPTTFFLFLVEERPDATNVNNWHWTEKNADAWSKSKIKASEDLIFFPVVSLSSFSWSLPIHRIILR